MSGIVLSRLFKVLVADPKTEVRGPPPTGTEPTRLYAVPRRFLGLTVKAPEPTGGSEGKESSAKAKQFLVLIVSTDNLEFALSIGH